MGAMTVWATVPNTFFIYLASPQGQGHHNSVSQLPYYLTPLSTFPVGGNWSTQRKPTTFGRALTILFSHEDWVWVHIKMNFTGDRTQNLRGERQVVWPLHHRSPTCPEYKIASNLDIWKIIYLFIHSINYLFILCLLFLAAMILIT